jgi:hypothetical protein
MPATNRPAAPGAILTAAPFNDVELTFGFDPAAELDVPEAALDFSPTVLGILPSTKDAPHVEETAESAEEVVEVPAAWETRPCSLVTSAWVQSVHSTLAGNCVKSSPKPETPLANRLVTVEVLT